MAIFTTDGKVLASLLFKEKFALNKFWCAIGQIGEYEQWQWDCQDSTNTNIPIELMDACNYNENFAYGSTGIQGMKLCEECYNVIPDSTGTIVFDATNYAIVTDIDEIYSRNARWLYFKFVLRYGELDIVPFRQIGLFYEPEHAAGEGAIVIQPSQITDPGRLFYYSNASVRYRHLNQKDIIDVIIQF